MTVATSDGDRIWGFRYSSEGTSRSLFYSTLVSTLREQYPDNSLFHGALGRHEARRLGAARRPRRRLERGAGIELRSDPEADKTSFTPSLRKHRRDPRRRNGSGQAARPFGAENRAERPPGEAGREPGDVPREPLVVLSLYVLRLASGGTPYSLLTPTGDERTFSSGSRARPRLHARQPVRRPRPRTRARVSPSPTRTTWGASREQSRAG